MSECNCDNCKCKTKTKGWKFALIKVHIEEEGMELEEQINLLVELYPLGPNGEYDVFCEARINSLEELTLAKQDVERDGINDWFYEHGVFEFKPDGYSQQSVWNWTRKE